MTCPICNGFASLDKKCPHCKEQMKDVGKAQDYLDEYSPYEEIDLMKSENGFYIPSNEQQCAHLIYCLSCHDSSIVLISEQ